MEEARSDFFGIVDVYWPDGPVESYRLVKPSTAIGRSTGNDIVLDTTTVSRYHVTLSFQEQRAYIQDLDSVNGTYIDGVRLVADTPHILRGGDEVVVGDIRLIFHPPADSTLASGEEEVTRRITVTQPTYLVELQGPDMPVPPGAHVQATLQIQNVSESAEHFLVEVDGLPDGWARLDRVEFEIGPGLVDQVLISLKPLRRSDSLPGEHAFIVRVRTVSDQDEAVEVPAVLRVLPYSGFGMALAQSFVPESGSFTLYVHNQGSAPLPLVVSGLDDEQALRFAIPHASCTLAPGERRTLVGTIKPRQQRIFGQPREREFAVLVHAQDTSGFVASVPGTYLEKSLLPAWVPVLAVPIIALVTMLVIGGLMLFLGRGEDAPVEPPIIHDFSITASAIPVGEPAYFAWDVAGADAITLVTESDAGPQRYSLELNESTYELRYEDSGVYGVLLEARKGDQISTASITVEVYPAITALELQVMSGANELVRNVQSDVRITWQVQGAKPFDQGYSIQIFGGSTNTFRISPPLEESGFRDATVLVETDQTTWQVVLEVDGQDNLRARTERTLPVVFPSCELIADRTIVRGGPDAAYSALVPPLAGTAEGNVSLSPIARDPSGAWFQVMIGVDNSRAGWVRAADFSCVNFEPNRLRVSSDYPPLPATSTPAPTLTLSPTLTPSPQPTTLVPTVPVTQTPKP